MASLAEIGKYYPEINLNYTVDGPSVFGEPDPVTLDLIRQIPVSGKVVEVGAGDGRYSLPMAEMGLEVVAGDVSKAALDTLSKKAENRGLTIPTVIFNGSEPFPKELHEADAVVNTALLYLLPQEHIREFAEASHQALRKNGVLIVDFVTDRQRIGVDGNEIRGKNEISYDIYGGLQTLAKTIDGIFEIDALKFSDVDQDLRETAGYTMKAKKISVLAKRK